MNKSSGGEFISLREEYEEAEKEKLLLLKHRAEVVILGKEETKIAKKLNSTGPFTNAAVRFEISPEKIFMNRESKLFIDTNILIYASLDDFEPAKYSVSTNKKYLKNPLSIKDAIQKVKEFRENFEVLNSFT